MRESVKESTVTNGFGKTGLLRVGNSATSAVTVPRNESESKNDTDRETEKVCDGDVLRL